MWTPLQSIADRLAQRRARHLEQRFFRRFSGRTLLVHEGLDLEWLEGLLKVGGGAAPFRIDTRRLPGDRHTPVEWVVQQFILPLTLPAPLLVIVRDRSLVVRHLRRREHVFDPSEIPSVLDDMSLRNRAHAWVTDREGHWMIERGMCTRDNHYELTD
ncbi:MAG: hypothetical protein ACYCRH_02115 [Acidiferrobacteraceae bacterium]